MPFGYFGAKHGLARFYPPPQYSMVIEPFVGSAAYSCYWASQGAVKHVIGYDKDPLIIGLWRRLQRMSLDELLNIKCPIKGSVITEPLIGLSAGGAQGYSLLKGRPQKVTDRMVIQWPQMQRRMVKYLPLIRKWEIRLGDGRKISNREATWFVDPPYKIRLGASKKMTAGGASYRYPLHDDDYIKLGEWCKQLYGQVIVCEQMPASWLPFVDFRKKRNGVGAGAGTTRTEAIWVKGRNQ